MVRRFIFFILIFEDPVNKNKEYKKYNPPSHCELDLQINKGSSISLVFSNIVNPVDVKPDIASK